MSPDAPKPLMEDLASVDDWLRRQMRVEAKSVPFPTIAEAERGERAEKRSAIPAIGETHIFQPFLAVFTTAAVQLISTSDWPGSAATATQVRAGPPFGK